MATTPLHSAADLARMPDDARYSGMQKSCRDRGVRVAWTSSASGPTGAASSAPTAEGVRQLLSKALYELIRGELRPMSPVGKPHGRLLFRIGAPLSSHAEERGSGAVSGEDIGVILERDPDTVLAPDIAFVRGAPPTLIGEEEGSFVLVPDLVIEIASPSNGRPELRDKVALYLEAGVPAVWLFERLTRTVALFGAAAGESVLSDTGTLDGGTVVPGFRLPVLDVFR